MNDAALLRLLNRTGMPLVKSGVEATHHIEQALWNSDAAVQARAVVECSNTADIQGIVSIATDHGLPLAVLSGGHDWAARAGAPQGITLDLRRMNRVTFDLAAETVKVEGGALIGDVLDALPDDRVMVSGTISSVGVVGLTLGGGYGKLHSRYGLALDNMVSANVVLADGNIVVASEQSDAELFWALRGGGGNFGVVTTITMTALHLPRVLTGLFFVPLASAIDGLLAMQAILDDTGDELSIFSALMTGPSGEKGLILAPLWSGQESVGERVFQKIARLPGAQAVAQGWSPFKDTYSKEFEAGWPKGRGYAMDAVNIPSLNTAAAEILVECARRLPTGADCIMLHDFHGACARVEPAATAFPLREKHYNVQLLAGWTEARGADAGRAWIEATRSALVPVSVRGGYPNILGPQQEARARARAFYGDASDRLLAAKRLYDPLNLFRSNTGQL
jgi:FAD/FMN-containing dehydrogenase